MSKSAMTDITIELHVPNFDKVLDFYGKLGFTKVWEYPQKGQSGYLVMRRENSILAFFCGNDEVYNHSYFKNFSKTTPRGYGVEIVLYVHNESIGDYYKKTVERIGNEHVAQKLEMQPWGIKDFRVIDPFGYYICIREPDDILKP